MTGENIDISEYLDFAFYGCCWYNNNAGIGATNLGKRLGVSHIIDSLISYWVLTANGTVVSRMTASRITNLRTKLMKTRQV